MTTITQRTSPTATPKNTSYHPKSDVISTSSKKSFSSPNKSHHRSRPIKSPSSSSSSLTSINSDKNHRYSSPKHHHHHRIVPYHNSDSDDNKSHRKKSYSTRNESSQTINNIHIMKNEQEQTDDQFLLEQFSDNTSNHFLQAPLDQIKHYYDQTTSSRKLLLSMTNIFDNPTKDFRRKRTDLIPVIKSMQTFDDYIYRLF